MPHQQDNTLHYLVSFKMGQVHFAFPLDQCLGVLLPADLFLIKDKILFNTNETTYFDCVFADDINNFFLYAGQIVPLITLSKQLAIYDSDPMQYILCLSIDHYHIGIELTAMIDVLAYTKEDILYDDKVTNNKYLKFQVSIDNKCPTYMIDFLQLDYFK